MQSGMLIYTLKHCDVFDISEIHGLTLQLIPYIGIILLKLKNLRCYILCAILNEALVRIIGVSNGCCEVESVCVKLTITAFRKLKASNFSRTSRSVDRGTTLSVEFRSAKAPPVRSLSPSRVIREPRALKNLSS